MDPLAPCSRARRCRSLLLCCALVALGSAGCVTPAAQRLAESDYLALGSVDDPLVVAAAFVALSPAATTRAALLRDLAQLFVARGQYANTRTVLTGATNELTQNNPLEDTFYYPVSREISTHDDSVGSIMRAQLYLDIIDIYREIESAAEIEGASEKEGAAETERAGSGELLRAALNEMFRAPQNVAHRQLLIRYLTLAASLAVSDSALLSKPVEAILLYRNPILYSDLLQFLINFYTQESQENRGAQEAAEQYMQMLSLEYREQYDWVSLAINTALHHDGWVSAERLKRIRARALYSPPLLAQPHDTDTAALGLARGSGGDIVTLYQQLIDPEVRCAFALSQQEALVLILRAPDTPPQIVECINSAGSREQPLATRAPLIAAAAVRAGVFSEELLRSITMRTGVAQHPAVYLRLAEELLARNSTAQARRYMAEVSERFDTEITEYADAHRFARLYGTTHTATQLVEQLQVKRNPLLIAAILLELDRRYGHPPSPAYRQIISQTLATIID